MPLEQLLLALIATWVAARLFGQVFASLGQAAMLGELLAGVLIGSHVLGWVPDHEFIRHLAEIGVLVLLFEVGLETDLLGLVRAGPKSLVVAAVGMILPMVGGYLVGRAAGLEFAGCVVLGGALSATSIAITSYALTQLGVAQTEEGRIIVGAAVIDDVLGLVVLGVTAKLVSAGAVTPVFAVGVAVRAIAFLLGALLLGTLLARPLLRLVDRMTVRGALTSVALAFALGLALLAQYLGSAPLVGAYAAGVVLARTHRAKMILERLDPIASVFVPIFFVTIGAQLDPRLLNPFDPAMWSAQTLALWIVLVAVLAKFACGFVAWGRGVGRAFIGMGMIPRGEVGLIFAQLGRSQGALNDTAFSALVIMVFITTLLPPILMVRMARPIRARMGPAEPPAAPQPEGEPN